MNRSVIIGIVVIFLFFLSCTFPKKSFAVVTTSLSNLPSTILTDSFTLTATISGASSGTNYLRVDLYKDQTTNYFGETYNGSYWYTGSDYTQFLPITIQSGTSWTGTIQGKFGDPSATDYDGIGTYKLRLRRYTSSGSYTSSEANVNAVTVAIAVPTSTPTPSPTNVPTNTPAPTATPTSAPTATTAPTKSPTSIPTPTSGVTQAVASESPTIADSEDATDSGVLGEATASAEKNAEESNAHQETVGSNSSRSKLPYVFMVSGFLFMGACGILAYRNYFKKHA